MAIIVVKCVVSVLILWVIVLVEFLCTLKFYKVLVLFSMASTLESYVNHTVSIITADGRNIVGTLKGFDQTINLILDESHERVYSSSQGIEQVVLGLYIVRGDNVAVVGEVDDELDQRLDLTNIKAEPLNPVVH
ncbi:U6 snRNA-associated Sm-like protein LSm8 [Stegodyphus dumicola]|uniref:U6 snRNA-associated Sm-like protein LSm8 n=1 Tax=Stegodyphus dumicola TaxID=202533 RepID=UPI0015AB1F13|nr:U6 snRNA-associated Sm-like protein LSm8 [Stegodyphus dumicola]